MPAGKASFWLDAKRLSLLRKVKQCPANEPKGPLQDVLAPTGRHSCSTRTSSPRQAVMWPAVDHQMPETTKRTLRKVPYVELVKWPVDVCRTENNLLNARCLIVLTGLELRGPCIGPLDYWTSGSRAASCDASHHQGLIGLLYSAWPGLLGC